MNVSLNNTDRDSGYTLPELLLTLALTALLILAGSLWLALASVRPATGEQRPPADGFYRALAVACRVG